MDADAHPCFRRSRPSSCATWRRAPRGPSAAWPPIPIDRCTPIACRGDQCPERGARRRTDLDRAAPVVAQFTWDIADAHEPSLTEHGGRAEGELEIETAADGQHDVRVTQHGPAHGSHHRGVRVGNQPAAFTAVDRVAALAYNCVEWLEIYAATAKAGLVAVPINFRMLGDDIPYILEDCAACALIVQDELLESLVGIRDRLSIPDRNLIQFGVKAVPAGWTAYEDLLGSGADTAVRIKAAPEDTWVLMYTSGTTGKPKGAMRSHGSHALFIVLRDGEKATESEIMEWCSGRLAGYKRPKSVSFIADAQMPRTATGKIQHRILKSRL